MPLRQPIVCVLGHVDAGKTSLLDKIRGSVVALREKGNMTQHIGASFFPLGTIEEICSSVLGKLSGKIKISGLLVIDTPGHSIFMNLRSRGGAIADIAILVVDILRGFELQTHESISILKSRKIPFIVAANKIDLIPGWKYTSGTFLESFNKQRGEVQRNLDNLLYSIIGSLSKLGFNSERYDRVTDFTKSVAIVPVSAKTGEGIPELLAVLVGLTQEFMQNKLIISEGNARGTILEVNEEPGLGITVNVIIYDGILHKNDTIIIGGYEKPIVTNIKAILLPKPLDEIRDPRDKFSPVDYVQAASGIKISAQNLELALAGAPLYAVNPNQSVEDIVRIVSEEVNSLRITTDKIGVILKTDTLGSLEAITQEFENLKIPIRMADVGNVSKRDVTEASLVKRLSQIYGVILSFNVKLLPDAKEESKIKEVPIFSNDIVYHLIDDYNKWMENEKERIRSTTFNAITKPGKIKVLPGFIFRRSDPAIFGIEVMSGIIKPGCKLINSNGKQIGEVMQVQEKGLSIQEASVGKEAAISVRDANVGKYFDEGKMLYVDTTEKNVKELLEKYRDMLSSKDIEAINELIEIKRRKQPLWGI